MRRGEHKIDWKSAVVREGELKVPVAGHPGGLWRRAFDQLIGIHNKRLAARRWGHVSLTGGPEPQVEVEDVTPGAEADLKEQLDHLAARASERAVAEEAKLAKQHEKLRASRKAREDEAAEMQERFRAA